MTKVDTDPAISFLQDPRVQSTFLSILVAAVFLLIITTFIGIIKTEFDKKDNSKTPVIENAIKGLAYFFVVPITCFLGIFVANIVLKMLDSATANGASRFSNQIFVAAAYDSNRIRRDQDANAVGEAYKYYLNRTNTREVISPYTDYVLQTINNCCYEVTIEENNEIKTVYALKKKYFLESPREDSSFVTVNPTKFFDEFKYSEYYSSLSTKEQLFIENVVDIKIWLSEGVYTHPVGIYQQNYSPQEDLNESSDIHVEDQTALMQNNGVQVLSIVELDNGEKASITIANIDAIRRILDENCYYFFTTHLTSENSYYSTRASFHADLKLSDDANIAHGCNSVIATKMALRLGDYCITEAGFGADLGAEKFLDIKCRFAGLRPDAVVIVATVRALKHHGGVAKADLGQENLAALEKGLPNLLQHVENITKVFGLPAVVAINRFPQDSEAELALIESKCKELGVNVALSEVWAKGGEGGIALAEEVVRLCEQKNDFRFSYDLDMSIKDKLDAIARKIYHADGVDLIQNAPKQLQQMEALGFDKLPICMAKTQYSFSDNQTMLGAPKGFRIQVRNLKVSAGAGFLVALTGDIMTMPGLPKVPAAEKIDVDENGRISGLF